MDDLDRAIALWEEIVQATPEGHVSLSGSLNILENSLGH